MDDEDKIDINTDILKMLDEDAEAEWFDRKLFIVKSAVLHDKWRGERAKAFQENERNKQPKKGKDKEEEQPEDQGEENKDDPTKGQTAANKGNKAYLRDELIGGQADKAGDR